jgi:membrane-bound lytic murein transglycosylase D
VFKKAVDRRKYNIISMQYKVAETLLLHMKILPGLLRCSFVLLLVSLSACSPHTKQSSLNQLAGSEGTDIASPAEEVSTLVEPEETAQEELAALKQLGVSKEGSLASLPEGLNLSQYDFPVTINKQVLYYLDLFQGKQRKSFTTWLARSSQYIPSIQQEFKKAGLPRDLAYLAMIESGFNPSAYSPADASGLWQFIEGTGRNHGLKIDSWVDERREPDKATKAAIHYLSHLYTEFGDWYLAVAAYNAGEKKIETAIKNYNTENFWEIAGSDGIYLETKRYVPKLIAAILIARNPEKFGFTDIKYQKPQQYDIIDVPGGVDLEAIAVSGNISVKWLRMLNNELQKNQTPAKIKNYALRIPTGTKELVASNLDRLLPIPTTIYTTHTVRNGETLTTICNLYNISKTTLLKANNLRTAELKKGLHIQIPSTTTKYVLLKKGERPEDRLAKLNNGNRQTVRHQMKSGETLASIAKQYQVPVKTLMQWNKISDLRQVKKGQQLTLHLERPAPEAITLTKVAKATLPKASADIPSLEATKKRSIAITSAQPSSPAPPKTKQPTWYVVQNGDSVWNIAKKFQVSAQDLRQWNKLSSNNLQTGDKLIVKREG